MYYQFCSAYFSGISVGSGGSVGDNDSNGGCRDVSDGHFV